jgi:hypothetical protein
MTGYDNIMVAAQEHAAKHALVTLCILLHYKKNGRCFIGRALAFMPSINHISASFTLQV